MINVLSHCLKTKTQTLFKFLPACEKLISFIKNSSCMYVVNVVAIENWISRIQGYKILHIMSFASKKSNIKSSHKYTVMNIKFL